MLSDKQLNALINARREEAAVLLENGKLDGAVYLAGYSVELTLKLIILRNGFPERADEFKVWADAKTHNLDNLLRLAGKSELREDDIFGPDWEMVTKNWSEESRYRKIGEITEEIAKMTMESISRIISRLME